MYTVSWSNYDQVTKAAVAGNNSEFWSRPFTLLDIKIFKVLFPDFYTENSAFQYQQNQEGQKKVTKFCLISLWKLEKVTVIYIFFMYLI